MKALYPTPRICIRLPYETPSMNSCRKWSSRAVCCLLSILCRNARYTPCQMEKPCSDWIICVYNRLKNTLPLCNSGRACKALFFRTPYFSHYISFIHKKRPAGCTLQASFISYDMQIESVSYPFSVSLFTGSIPHFHFQLTSSSSGVYHTMYMFAAISYS